MKVGHLLKNIKNEKKLGWIEFLMMDEKVSM
jgi:hypothetical protein